MLTLEVRSGSIGLQKLPRKDEQGHSHKLIVLDGQLGENGELVPGSGTGIVVQVLLDESTVKTLHAQSETSPLVVPRRPTLLTK